MGVFLGTEIYHNGENRFKEVEICCDYWIRHMRGNYRILRLDSVCCSWVAVLHTHNGWNLPIYHCPGCGLQYRVHIKTDAEVLAVAGIKGDSNAK